MKQLLILVANPVLPVCYGSIAFSFRRPMVLYQSPDYAFWVLRGIRHQYHCWAWVYLGDYQCFTDLVGRLRAIADVIQIWIIYHGAALAPVLSIIF